MTNRYWEYQNRREYNRNKAEQWAHEARMASFNAASRRAVQIEGLDPAAAPQTPTMFDTALTNRDLGKELGIPSTRPTPAENKDRGFLDRIGLTDIDQPWDVLRPVARLMEAEQKYIARPLAKKAYNVLTSPIELVGDAPEYDELPGGVQLGLEILTSPSTWVGAGTASRIARLAPKLAGGLPLVGLTAPGKGSRRAIQYVLENTLAAAGAGAGYELGEAAGLPPWSTQIAGGVGGALAGKRLGNRFRPDKLTFNPGTKFEIVNPENQRVYHGTIREFEGLPATPTQGRQNQQYMIADPDAVYFTFDPEIASSQGAHTAEGMGGQWQGRTGGRIIPAVLKKGAKIWDPVQDEWPTGKIQLEGGEFFDLPPSAQKDLKTDVLAWAVNGRELRTYDDARDAYRRGEWQSESTKGYLPDPQPGQLPKQMAQARYKNQNRLMAQQTGAAEWQEVYYEGKKEWHNRTTGEIISDAPPGFDPNTKELYEGTEPGIYDKLGDSTESSWDALKDLPGLKDWLRSQGYAGVATPFELAIFDTSVLEPAYMNRAPGIINSIVSGKDGGQEKLRIKLQQALKSDDEALESLSPEAQAAKADAAYSDFREGLKQSLDIEGVVQRLQNGTATADDMLKGTAFLRSKGIQVGDEFRPGGSFPGDLSEFEEMYAALNDLPDEAFKARGVADIIDYYAGNQSLTVKARKYAHQGLQTTEFGKAVESYLGRVGLRFIDDDLSFFLTENWRMRALGNNYGAGADAQLRATSRPINNIVTSSGAADIEDLISNYKSMNLTPADRALIETYTEPIGMALATAKAFGVKGVPDFETPTGRYVHFQPKTEAGVRSGFGAVQPAQRRSKITSRTGAKVELRDFFDAQHALIGQLHTASADAWLNAIIKKYGKSMKDLVGEDLYKERDRLTGELSKAKDAIKELNDLTSYDPTAQVDLDKMLLKRDDLITKRQEIRDEIKAAQEDIQRRRGTEDYPVEFRGTYYPESGRQLQTLMRRDDFLTKLNSQFRPLMATLDLSFMGNQGLLGLARNPVAYARSFIQALSSSAYEQRIRDFVEDGTLGRAQKSGVALLARNDLGEFMATGGLPEAIKSVVPGARMGIDAANTWFSRFGNAMRLELFSASEGMMKSQDELNQLARFVNLATGIGESPTTRFENVMTFAPRYMRSQFGLLADALTKNDVSGLQAKRTLLGLITGGAVLTYAMNEMFGEETDFDPDSPNFMRMRMFGQDVSVFGTWDTLARAAIKVADEGPKPGFEYLAQSKASPVMARLLDIIRGETFDGSKIDFGSTESMLSSMGALSKQILLPISVQGGIETLQEGGEPGAIAGGLATGLAGLKASPITERERRDIIAKDQFGKHWSELEPGQKQQLREDFPNITAVTPRTSEDKALAKRAAITERYSARQAEIDRAVPIGPEWRELRSNLIREMAGAFDEWAEENPDVAANLQSRKPRNAGEKAVQEYFAVFDQARALNWTPDEVGQQIDRIEAGWTDQQRAYFQRNTGLHDTPVVREYKADQSKLENYYSIEDQVWDRINNRPELEGYITANDYVEARAQALREQGVPEETIGYKVNQLPLLKRYAALVGDLKKKYRRAHPEADAVLVKWYGAVPIRLQR